MAKPSSSSSDSDDQTSFSLDSRLAPSSSSSTALYPQCSKLSRKLSYVLRHGAVNLKLPINSAGFVPLSALRTKVDGFDALTEDLLRHIVAHNKKNRFSLWSDHNNRLHIRANQGHSQSVAAHIDPNKLLQQLVVHDIPPLCVHGTTLNAWRQIRQTGLSRMNRDMIHFATGLPDEHEVVSGMRASSQVLVFVRVAAAIEDGVPFFRSENNVLLSPGVGDSGVLPTKYFDKVVRRDNGEVLMENFKFT